MMDGSQPCMARPVHVRRQDLAGWCWATTGPQPSVEFGPTRDRIAAAAQTAGGVDPTNIRRHPSGRPAVRLPNRRSGNRTRTAGSEAVKPARRPVHCSMALDFFFSFLFYSLFPPFFWLPRMQCPPYYHGDDDTIPIPIPTPATQLKRAVPFAVCLMRGRIGRARCPIAGKGFCGDGAVGLSLVAAVSRSRQCSDQSLSIFAFFVVETRRASEACLRRTEATLPNKRGEKRGIDLVAFL
ncbi:hypothetical protein F5144DRAFT_234344 [Chaetomium tenue]|uniref:Uncharacterized protein n=1 Tax=Chaetomium tenue TaxID=1854479 RepID=A0ACB7P703_9PEZI|nr:hypothetical protein F5144DRAFT_234344 [Chaetomium globosum]